VRPAVLVRILVPKVRLTPFPQIPRRLVLEVAATFKADAYPQDSQRAYIALDAARKLLDAPEHASWIELRLEDRRHLDPMKARIARAMGEGFQVLALP